MSALSDSSNDTSVSDVSDTTTDTDADGDGIRDNFKATMDSYEAFFDDYVEFMQKYANADSSDVMSMLTDYMTWLTKYTDTMAQFEAIENEDLNDAELAYYTEVSLRITQKLLTVAGTMQ